MNSQQTSGFTLIEIIVSIVFAAILGTVFVQFMNTMTAKTIDPVVWLDDEADISDQMEEIISDYIDQINTAPAGTLAALIAQYGSNPDVTMEPGGFNNSSGTWVSAPSGKNVKVIIQKQGHKLTTVLSETRNTTNDPPVPY